MDLQEKEIFGRLGSMSLADIIQILGVNKRTATLVLKHDGQKGKIFFKDGVVLHAFAGGSQGETAVLKFLEWVGAEFSIEEGISSIPMVTMFADAETIMLRMCSRLDEAKRDSHEKTVAPAADAPPATVARPPAAAKAMATQPVSQQKRAEKVKRIEKVLPSMTAAPARKRFSLPLMMGIAFAAIVLSLYFPSKFLSSGRASIAQELPAELDPQPAPVEIAEETSQPDALIEETVAAAEEDAFSGLAAADDDPAPVEATSNRPAPAIQPAEPPTVEPTPAPRASISPPVATEPAFGELLVVAEPWAEVYIDGEKVGQTPLSKIRLSAEEHTLSLSNDNFAGVIRDTITIPSNATLSKKYSFNDHGYLQIVVVPWADVFIDGNHVGQTPLERLNVPVGKHTVRLEHPQLGEQVKEIEIRSQEAILLRLEM